MTDEFTMLMGRWLNLNCKDRRGDYIRCYGESNCINKDMLPITCSPHTGALHLLLRQPPCPGATLLKRATVSCILMLIGHCSVRGTPRTYWVRTQGLSTVRWESHLAAPAASNTAITNGKLRGHSPVADKSPRTTHSKPDA
eukprot:scaffold304_cov409-Prasinococcus_capsulatus_cf.AAC.4